MLFVSDRSTLIFGKCTKKGRWNAGAHRCCPEKMNSTEETTTVAYDTALHIFWLIGIVISTLCLLTMTSFFILIRITRKLNEKILAQITFTRLLVTLCEYYIFYFEPKSVLSNDIMFCTYFATDFALVCLMLAFSKNLYNEIVIVFRAQKLNLIYTTVIIWSLSFILGFLGIYILKYQQFFFDFYCHVIHASLKFLIVSLNIMVYLRIFYVAYRRGKESDRDKKSALKSAFVAFLLVTTTCLQILITDLISYGQNIPEVVVKAFCVVNSYHAVLITAIYFIIVRKKLGESTIIKTVTIRLSELITWTYLF